MNERWARNEAVLWRRSPSGVAMKLPWDPEIVVLNESGQALWEALETPRTLRQVATQLATAYGVGLDMVERDLVLVLADLERRELVLRVAA